MEITAEFQDSIDINDLSGLLSDSPRKSSIIYIDDSQQDLSMLLTSKNPTPNKTVVQPMAINTSELE